MLPGYLALLIADGSAAASRPVAVWLLADKDIPVILPTPSGGVPARQWPSMYGYGVGCAIASMCCAVGPFLAVISATFTQGSLLSGVPAFLAYAGGMSITVGVAALAVALAGAAAADPLRRVLPHVGRAAGEGGICRTGQSRSPGVSRRRAVRVNRGQCGRWSSLHRAEPDVDGVPPGPARTDSGASDAVFGHQPAVGAHQPRVKRFC
ncbi:hypothetical protein MBOT_07270 [Mycobacterium botniense]|uniref:Uncharacterized protein n=1 Tax=Mycobacterium botniense TaxID=84962 RepID=A0A7I9XTP3_9MYCO|nr:hypothetical protein MBOT_07270 [Mycobacterium botniense]